MLDSPLLQEMLAERTREVLLTFLEGRFGSVPEELVGRLRSVSDLETLKGLAQPAARCPDLEALAALLPEIDQPFVVTAPECE